MSGQNQQDALLLGTLALPNGSAAASLGAALQLGQTSRGDFLADCEFLVSGPALNGTQLPSTKTMTYDLVTADNSALSTNLRELGKGVLVQTGSGTNGASAATARLKAPTNVQDYVGLRATNSGAGDASGASATLKILT